MTISLSDIPTAVADYIKDNVTVEVTEVKHGISTVLQPHEKGKFDVIVTNNGNVPSHRPHLRAVDLAGQCGQARVPGRDPHHCKAVDPDSDVIPNGDEADQDVRDAQRRNRVRLGRSRRQRDFSGAAGLDGEHARDSHDQVLDPHDRRPGELVPRGRGELGGEADVDGQLTLSTTSTRSDRFRCFG